MKPLYITPRDWEAALGVLQAKSNIEIAQDMGVKARTVKYHLKTLYKKFKMRGCAPGKRVRLAIMMHQNYAEMEKLVCELDGTKPIIQPMENMAAAS